MPASPHEQPKIYVAAAPNDDHNTLRADTLAQQLALPRCPHAKSPPPDAQLLLTVTHHRLELRVPEDAPGVAQELHGGHAVAPDFTQLDTSSAAGRSLKAPLFRALGLHKTKPNERLAVLDCTAGLLEDSWLLAAAGCQVTALERHPLLHLLLYDALTRAAQTHSDPTTRTNPTTAARINLHHADATTFLISPIAHRPSHILIDPMFPPGRKTAERKPLRLLRLLAGPDADSSQLLQTALTATTASGASGARVVVKRPRKAPPLLPDPAPQHTVEGKGFRFDIYPQP